MAAVRVHCFGTAAFVVDTMSIRDEVLVLTDRFYSTSDPDAIDRQSQLEKCLVIVLLIHITTAIAFWKGYELEKSVRHVIRDVDVTFEFNIAPPEPEPLLIKPPSIPLINPPVGSAVKTPVKPQDLRIKPRSTPLIKRPVHLPIKRYPVQPPNTILTPTRPLVPPLPVSQGETKPLGGGVTVPTGITGVGTGAGTGNDKGSGVPIAFVPPPVITKVIDGKEMGNIAPYRNHMFIEIAKNWQPANSIRHMIVQISIGQTGELLSFKLVQSSGDKRYDREAERAILATKYDPLPDWYRGSQLAFRIDMSSMTAVLLPARH